MNRKRVLFLSDKNRYLEHEPYCLVAKELASEVETYYFESDYSKDITLNETGSIDREEKKAVFSHYLTIPPLNKDMRSLRNPIEKLVRIAKNHGKMYKWKREYLQKVDQINPDAVVLISPYSFNASLIRNYRKDISNRFYLQSCMTRRTQKIPSSSPRARFIYHKLLGLPYLPAPKKVFEIDEQLTYLMWSRIWAGDNYADKESSFVFTGAPVYDKALRAKVTIKCIPEKANVLIYLNKTKNMGQAGWNAYADFYRAIGEAYPQVKFIFKAHPLSNLETCQNAFPAATVTHAKVPWEQVNLVLTHWSTTCVDSILYGLPTILINPDRQFDFRERYLDQYEAIANNLEEFKSIFDNFSDNEKSKFPEYRENFITQTLNSTDGKSTERVAEAIKNVLN